MARIPLRDYHREIEELIENGQIDQAIAHCKHLLTSFPKHVDTYRLLGKAYLESQRYSDATDILQRVLSSIPDDFIAHVGMSMIREDEGNLDEAIWHMERAFEVQPANAAIQGELRRLYGRRDGVEPLKVRLTRGALARMYIKGALYPQAVTELRAALSEDPERPDLLVPLARANFLAGQKVEAAETCSTLLAKLPYCLEANQILAEVLSGSERAGEAQTYRQRVEALDPYTAHLSPANPTAEQIPDSAVTVERLDWLPGQSIAGVPTQPGWAASLGVNINELEAEDETLPDWLSDDSASVGGEEKADEAAAFQTGTEPDQTEEAAAGTAAAGAAVFDSGSAEPTADDQIPDWMREAGWEPLSGSAGEAEAALFSSEEEAPAEELSPSEIPDWLRSMAPPEAIQEHEPQEQPAEDFLPWLDDTPPGASDSVVNWLEGMPGEQENIPAPAEMEEASELPDWMAGTTETGQEAEIPDWLQNLEPEEASGIETAPGWQVESEAGTPQAEPGQQAPAQAEREEAENEPGLQFLAAAGAMAWMSEGEGDQPDQAAQTVPGEKEGSESEDEAAAFAWLENLAAQQGASEGLLLTPEERREDLPEWLSELEEGAEAAEPDWIAQDLAGALDEAQPGTAEDETPAWLQDSAGEPETGSQAEQPEWMAFSAIEDSPQSAVEQPDWMAETFGSSDAEPLAETPAGLPDEAVAAAAGLPDWLNTLDDEILGQEEAQPERSAENDLPDWLQAMEVETADGAESETAQGAPGRLHIDEGPISEEDTKPTRVAYAMEIPVPPEFRMPPAQEQVSTPDEALEAASEPDAAAGDEFEPSLEGAYQPQPFLEEAGQGAGESTDDASLTDTEADSMDLASVEAIAEEGPALEAAGEAGGEEAPPEELPAPAAEEAPEAQAEGLDDQDAAFAWLESLAVRQGVEEGLLVNPEERLESPPDWVVETPSEAPSAEAAHEPEEEVSAPEAAEGPDAGPVDAAGKAAIFGSAVLGAAAIFSQPDEEDTAAEAERETPATAETETSPAAAGEEPAVDTAPPQVEPGQAPEWQSEIGTGQTVEAEPVDQAAAGEIDSETGQTQETAFATELPAAEELPSAEELPFAEELPAADEMPELPTWLQEIREDQESESAEWTPPAEYPAEAAVYTSPAEVPTPVEPDEAPPAAEQEVQPAAEGEIILIQARNALVQDNRDEALKGYTRLVKSRILLDDVIQDLNEALYRFPVDIPIWEVLGDAYARNGQLQEALDTYTKAEELLR